MSLIVRAGEVREKKIDVKRESARYNDSFLMLDFYVIFNRTGSDYLYRVSGGMTREPFNYSTV